MNTSHSHSFVAADAEEEVLRIASIIITSVF